MKKIANDWIHAGLIFLLTFFAGSVGLSLVRLWPRTVHAFFVIHLTDWLRIGFVFFLCTLFAVAMFRLLSPRLGHLRYWRTHPPAWVAVLLGLIVVAVLDIADWLNPGGYRATVWEWLGYAGGSLLIVGWYSEAWKGTTTLCWGTEKRSEPNGTQNRRLQGINNAAWDDIEQWLGSNTPAQYDRFGNRIVADRLADLLIDGTRSIGIIGAFGAGKTTIVDWIRENINAATSSSKQYFVCPCSCWGFETSASAIYDMLAKALGEIGAKNDTFQLDSLPDSYRQTFSAGGKWIDTIANMILRKRDPLDQFERLSVLLDDMNARLIFIVEDLDRNDTRGFEIQEVLGFLERLKPYRNLAFVLTGGLSSSGRIDFCLITGCAISPLATAFSIPRP